MAGLEPAGTPTFIRWVETLNIKGKHLEITVPLYLNVTERSRQSVEEGLITSNPLY